MVPQLIAGSLLLVGLLVVAVPLRFSWPEGWSWRGVWGAFYRGTTCRGWWLAVIPGVVLAVLFHTLVLHVRWGLGRWPNFGETVPGLMGWHTDAVWLGVGLAAGSLMAVPVAVVICALWPRWRPGVLYAVVHAASVGATYGSVFLAPGPFLNWFFD